MSRIRSIHPGLWTDDAFMALSAHARLLVIGLWTEAFDDGVFEWKTRTIRARIFPGDNNIDMDALLEEIVAGAFIRREEFDGKPIGLIRNFREYQRPKKPNSSSMLKSEWETYVGITAPSGGPIPNQSPTDGEKSPQMEDGGGKREDEEKTPPPVKDAEAGARDLFDEVWNAFPQNPSSVEAKAEAAFRATKAKDQPLILSAAQRYASWFAQDCEARKRTIDAGLRFVPHLSTWLESGAWRSADALPVKDSASAEPTVPMTRLDRDRDRDLWLRCEEIMGKKAPTSDFEWAFKAEIVAQARKELAH